MSIANKRAEPPGFSHGEHQTVEELIEFQEEDFCLWDRSIIYSTNTYKDYTIIVGHTAVQRITDDYENVKIFRNSVGTTFIDCGCPKSDILGCLRLDDLKEFYV